MFADTPKEGEWMKKIGESFISMRGIRTTPKYKLVCCYYIVCVVIYVVDGGFIIKLRR